MRRQSLATRHAKDQRKTRSGLRVLGDFTPSSPYVHRQMTNPPAHHLHRRARGLSPTKESKSPTTHSSITLAITKCVRVSSSVMIGRCGAVIARHHQHHPSGVKPTQLMTLGATGGCETTHYPPDYCVPMPFVALYRSHHSVHNSLSLARHNWKLSDEAALDALHLAARFADLAYAACRWHKVTPQSATGSEFDLDELMTEAETVLGLHKKGSPMMRKRRRRFAYISFVKANSRGVRL